MSRSARRIGADMVSKRSETLALPRSTANRNWNRSFDPTETKSTFFKQFVELIEQRRHLHHGADVDAFRQRMAVLAQIGQLALDDRLGLIEFGDIRNHREHDLQRAAAAGPQQRADLAAQQSRPVEPEPDRAPAERGIFLDHGLHIGQRLVAADVERPERHGLGAGGIQHRAIERELVGGCAAGSGRP